MQNFARTTKDNASTSVGHEEQWSTIFTWFEHIQKDRILQYHSVVGTLKDSAVSTEFYIDTLENSAGLAILKKITELTEFFTGHPRGHGSIFWDWTIRTRKQYL